MEYVLFNWMFSFTLIDKLFAKTSLLIGLLVSIFTWGLSVLWFAYSMPLLLRSSVISVRLLALI